MNQKKDFSIPKNHKLRSRILFTLGIMILALTVINPTTTVLALDADGRLTQSELQEYIFLKITWQSTAGSIPGGLIGLGTDSGTGNHFMYYQLPVDYKDNTWGNNEIDTSTYGDEGHQVGSYNSNPHTVRKIWQGDQLGGTGPGNRIVIRPTETLTTDRTNSVGTLEFNVDLLASEFGAAGSVNNLLVTGQLGNPFLGLKGLTQLSAENNGDFFQIGISPNQAVNFVKVATSSSWNIEHFGPSGTGNIAQSEIDAAIKLPANLLPGLMEDSPLVTTTTTSNLVTGGFTRVNPDDPTSPIIDYDNVNPTYDDWWFPASFEIELLADLFSGDDWTTQAVSDLINGNSETALVWVPSGGHISPNKYGVSGINTPIFELVPMPSIDLEKYVSVCDQSTWVDADLPTGPQAALGGCVYFKFDVLNDGNVPLSSVTLSDTDFSFATYTPSTSEGYSLSTDDIVFDDPINPGETYTVIIGPIDSVSGQHTDTGTAEGTYDSTVYDDTDDANYFGAYTPSVDIEKYVSVDDQSTWVDADLPTGPQAVPGESVYFKFDVLNDGNVPLSSVTLDDDIFDFTLITGVEYYDDSATSTTTITSPSGYTVSGGTVSFTDPLDPDDMYIVIIGPISAVSGQHTDTGTVEGTYDSTVYDDTDDANYFGEDPSPPESPNVGGHLVYTNFLQYLYMRTIIIFILLILGSQYLRSQKRVISFQ